LLPELDASKCKSNKACEGRVAAKLELFLKKHCAPLSKVFRDTIKHCPVNAVLAKLKAIRSLKAAKKFLKDVKTVHWPHLKEAIINQTLHGSKICNDLSIPVKERMVGCIQKDKAMGLAGSCFSWLSSKLLAIGSQMAVPEYQLPCWCSLFVKPFMNPKYAIRVSSWRKVWSENPTIPVESFRSHRTTSPVSPVQWKQLDTSPVGPFQWTIAKMENPDTPKTASGAHDPAYPQAKAVCEFWVTAENKACLASNRGNAFGQRDLNGIHSPYLFSNVSHHMARCNCRALNTRAVTSGISYVGKNRAAECKQTFVMVDSIVRNLWAGLTTLQTLQLYDTEGVRCGNAEPSKCSS